MNTILNYTSHTYWASEEKFYLELLTFLTSSLSVFYDAVLFKHIVRISKRLVRRLNFKSVGHSLLHIFSEWRLFFQEFFCIFDKFFYWRKYSPYKRINLMWEKELRNFRSSKICCEGKQGMLAANRVQGGRVPANSTLRQRVLYKRSVLLK